MGMTSFIQRRPLLVPIASFLFGILLVDVLIPHGLRPCIGYLCAGVSLLLSVFFVRKYDKAFYALLCLFFFFLGIFRYSTEIYPRKTDIGQYRGQALVFGEVTGEAEWRGKDFAKRLVFPFRCKRIRIEEKESEVSGILQVSLFDSSLVPIIGDRAAVMGTIEMSPVRTNPEGFDYSRILLRKGIRGIMSCICDKDIYIVGYNTSPAYILRRWVCLMRMKADIVLSKYLCGEARAVVRAAVLGYRDGIPEGVKELFLRTGTMHILAVSGLHVGIVAMIITGILGLFRCPRRIIYIFAISGICMFALFSGCRASSVRAALMGSFILIGIFGGRETKALDNLILSAICITFLYPGELVGAGFVLSYLAVLCIIFMVPLADSFLGIRQVPAGRKKFTDSRMSDAIKAVKRYMSKAVSVSLAVWSGMMPVTAFYFKIITPVTVFSNLIALPVLTGIVTLGFATLALEWIMPVIPQAGIIPLLLSFITYFFLGVMSFFDKIPFAHIAVGSPPWGMIALFYSAFGILVYVSRYRGSGRTVFLIMLLLSANTFVWSEALSKPPAAIRVVFFDTGRADMILFEFPDGSVMLVDGGSSGKKKGIDGGKNILEPYLRKRGIRKIDCVVITHAHEDHVGGLLSVFGTFRIGTVLIGSGCPKEAADRLIYGRLEKTILDNGTECIQIKRGDIVSGLYDMELIVLNPPAYHKYGDLNKDSIVLKTVTSSGSAILLCADACDDAVKDILCFGNVLKSDVIKVPHHGGSVGDRISLEEFFVSVGSRYAVVTNDSEENLSRVTREALSMSVSEIYVTGESGAMIFEETEKGFRVVGQMRE